jgi:tetratricopeptide (TPR) repeat protein
MNIRVTLTAALMLLPSGAGAQAPQVRLGRIEFRTSGRADAQPHFLLGVLFLHSFEYDSAAGHFRVAQRLDPNFAMAYWGEAMTYNHPVWMQQDSIAARAVLARLAGTPGERRARAGTERERRWLDAIERLYGPGGKEQRDSLYAQEMEQFARDFRGDHEVMTFHALSLLGLAHTGRDVPTYMRAAAVAEEVYGENPQHPGALHVLIHSYDDPVHAPLGLRAARAYSEVAPSAAHAQHMTSHIFVSMGMWDDVERANIAAWEATNRRNGHYTHWLSYGYLQKGRYSDAERYVRAIVTDAARDPTDYKIGYRNVMLAGFLVDTEDWTGPWARYAVDSVRPGVSATNARQLTFARGLVALARGDRAAANRALDSLYASLRRGKQTAGYVPWLGAAEVMAELLRAAQLASVSLLDSAILVSRAAASREAGLPFEFGPPETIKPPFEMLGELLLKARRPGEARDAFVRALARTPNRSRSVLGLARSAAALGDTTQALHNYGRFRANQSGDVPSAERREADDYLAAARRAAVRK